MRRCSVPLLMSSAAHLIGERNAAAIIEIVDELKIHKA
jgi:hypothetical protein